MVRWRERLIERLQTVRPAGRPTGDCVPAHVVDATEAGGNKEMNSAFNLFVDDEVVEKNQ
jgi:hypothetical protein